MKRYFLICVAALMGLACAQAQEVTIGSKADWDAFAARVNAGETSLNAIMTADILEGVTTIVGTQSNPYRGTFNGDGHTLTLALNSNARYCAPFSRVSGATIENLKTTGRVVPSGYYEDPRRHASGLVGNNDGGFTARNCWVAADIVGSTYSGGLLGHGCNSPFTMENCLFSGSNNATFNVGGLVGWCDTNCMPTITNCLNAGTFSYSGFAPIARVDGKGTVTNCYYTTSTSCSSELRDDRGTFTDKTGRELAQLLGDGWGVNESNAVPIVFAKYMLSVPDVLLKPGETASVGIGMNSEWTNLVSFQMDVYLPEGISVNRSGCSLTSRFSSGDLSIGRQSDGSYRLAATSYSLSPITGTEGDLVNLSLTASAGAAEGEAAIRNIRFVTSSSASILSEDVTFNIMSYMEQSIALTELPVMTYGDGVYTLPEETEQGMPIDWSVDNSAVAKVVGNNLMIRGAGTATVTAYQEGNDRYMELEKSYQLTVNKAPLTVTANSYTIEQGEALPAFEATYEGFVNNQSASALTTQPTFSCTAANSDVPGTYEITVGGAESQNYELTYVGGTLTITTQPAVTITANSYTMVYGDPLPTFEFTSEGGTPNGTPELTCEATSASPVGTYPITASKGTLSNYNVTYVAGTLTIVKAPLTITADDCTKKQGDPLPTYTATYEGFKNDDTAEVLTKQPTFSCSATVGSEPGTYEITVGGATAQNYDITFVNGTLTVNEADPVTITATSFTIHYGDAIPTLAYTSEGATLEGKPKLDCEATKYSPVGTYPITVAKGSVANYNVTYVEGTLTIEKAPLTVTAKSYTKKQGDEMPDYEVTYQGFKNNETTTALTTQPTATCDATPASAPGTYDIVPSGGEAENYEFAYVNGTLTVTEADQVIVRAKNYTIKYGEIIPTLGYTTEGASLDGVPALSCEATSSSPVGTYPITIEQGSVTNYNVTYVGGTLTIEKAPLTITAKDCTMKRGEELPEFEALYDGFKNNETAEVLTTQPTFSCEATPSSNMGTYIIGVSGAEAENYEITFVAGQLTITQADPVTVTAKNYTIEYGDELPELEYTTSGVALVGEPELFCSATPTSPVGTYPITVTQGTIENYNVAFVTGTLTIVKAELTVTAKSYTIKEGDPLPQYEALYDGFKNNETESVLSKLPTIDSMADENSPAGEYEIFVGGARAQNYKFKYVNGLLTIEARADHDCATPTITYVNGKLVYECETEGATFRSTITCEDIAEHVGNEVDLTVAYHISVVASAEGYNDSEPATATLCWIDTEPVESVATGVLEIPGTPVLLKSSNGEISVEGLANGTQVAVYTAEGMLVGSEKVADGKVVITTSLMPGTVAIVRMGNKAVKMVVR